MAEFPYQTSPNQIVFHAGILNYNTETKKITGDKRRGIVTVKKAEDIVTFTWSDRDKNSENEKNSLHDQELVTRLNLLLASPSDYDPIDAEQEESGTGDTQQQLQELEQLQQVQQRTNQYIENQANRQQQANANVDDQIRNIMNMLQQNNLARPQKKVPYLSVLFDNQFFDEIAADEDFANQLIQFLPEGQQSKEHLLENLRSAQLLQSLESFDRALNSGEVRGLIIQMGLDPKALEQTIDGNEALYNALQQWAQSQQKK